MVSRIKTTIDIPDELYRETKALAAMTGRTVRDLVTELLRERVEQERAREGPRGWRAVFGEVPKAAANQVQSVIDAEFSKVDPRDWE